ncbi:unnamed protein product [Urochloa humidicola]
MVALPELMMAGDSFIVFVSRSAIAFFVLCVPLSSSIGGGPAGEAMAVGSCHHGSREMTEGGEREIIVFYSIWAGVSIWTTGPMDRYSVHLHNVFRLAAVLFIHYGLLFLNIVVA